jgi:outer membrane usher protein
MHPPRRPSEARHATTASPCLPTLRPVWARLLGLAMAMNAAQATGVAADEPTDEIDTVAVAVVINGVGVSDGELAHQLKGDTGWWLLADQLAHWRVMPDAVAARRFQGRLHERICGSASALHCVRDMEAPQLVIAAPTNSLRALRLPVEVPRSARPDARTPATTYFNYELYGHQSPGGAWFTGVLALQTSTSWGHGGVAAGVAHGLPPDASRNARPSWRNARASWQWDWPEQQQSLVVGDFASESRWSHGWLSMRGLRWASNASLDLQRGAAVRPWIGSEARQPSMAELLVDGLYRRSVQVPYGPVSIEADALTAGAGLLELVLKDERGERRSVIRPYYFAPELLAPQRTQFAIEMGVPGHGDQLPYRASSSMFSFNARHGWNERCTLDASLVLAGRQRGISFEADQVIGANGLLRTAISLIKRGGGPVLRLSVGHEYQSRQLSSLIRLETVSAARSECPGCGIDVGSAPPGPPTADWRPPANAFNLVPDERRQMVLGLSVPLGPQWHATATYLRQQTQSGSTLRMANLALNWRHAERLQLSLGLQTRTAQARSHLLNFGVLLPFGNGWLGSSSVSQQRAGAVKQSHLQWSAQSTFDSSDTGASAENNTRVQLFGSAGPSGYAGASMAGANRYVSWGADVQHRAGEYQVGGRVAGAWGWVAGQFFASRRIDQSFIVVDTDGQPDVPVYFENRFAGNTGPNGRLTVPGARAFQSNRISIDGRALPIQYTLADDQLDVVPPSRGAALARFEISDGGRQIALRRADGSVAPVGAEVSVSTQKAAGVVNSRGEVFVQFGRRAATIEVRWPGGQCRVDYAPAVGASDHQAGEWVCL